jgi:hypothetical protein
MIRKRLMPLVLRLVNGSISAGSSSSVTGFVARDLSDVSSIIAHHAAVAVLWLTDATKSCGSGKSAAAAASPQLLASKSHVSLWLSHAVLQTKAMFTLVQRGSCLSNRERLLSSHSHWIHLPYDGLKAVLEDAADAIGEIVWPGGSRERVLTPKCQLRLRKVYELNEKADVTVVGDSSNSSSSSSGGGGGSSSSSSSSSSTLICMIVPTLSPPAVHKPSALPLLDVFLSSFTRSVGCDAEDEGFEYVIYVAYDQVRERGLWFYF